MARKSSKNQQKKATEKEKAEGRIIAFKERVFSHKLFKRFSHYVRFHVVDLPYPREAYIDQYGNIYYDLYKVSGPHVFARLILHLAFGDFATKQNFPKLWADACSYCIWVFMGKLSLFDISQYSSREMRDHQIGSEPERIYQRLLGDSSLSLSIYGVNGDKPDMVWSDKKPDRYNYKMPNWQEIFAKGLVQDASDALEQAAGVEATKQEKTQGQKAKQWFMTAFPLLGSTVAMFDVIENPRLLQANNVDIAAVDPHQRLLYIDTKELDEDQTRFIMAHLIMHVALRDSQRTEWRDPFIWNVACDYRINAWLLEMGVGALPTKDVLYDPKLAGLSADAIYDVIMKDVVRPYKKLATLKGKGEVDILPIKKDFWNTSEGVSLDDFFRELLAQGYDFHLQNQRGTLPASLVDEVKAAMMPPIPWDVKLARWFDENFRELEKRRTYSRRSRRQSAVPDIPLASYYTPPEALESHTFGIIFDTSASMEKVLIAKGLGTIVSYAQAKDVTQVRLIYSDAQPYDEGYVPVEDLLGRVKVKGRGGTILQPAVDLLLGAKNFPNDAPILIVTDGWIDFLTVRRTHAYLLPLGRGLPFRPQGEVFYVS